MSILYLDRPYRTRPSRSQLRGPLCVLAVAQDPSLTRLLDRGEGDGTLTVDRVTADKTALALVDLHRYDVILLEHGPTRESIVLCRRLRESGVTVPILIVAGGESVNDLAATLDRGADDYVVGPLNYPDLITRIRVLARLPSETGAQNPLLRESRPVGDPTGETSTQVQSWTSSISLER